MKPKLLFTLATLFVSCIIHAQEQDVDAPFYYQVSGLVFVNKYDQATRQQQFVHKIPKPGLKFEIVRKEKDVPGDYEYYIIKFLFITKDNITVSKGNVVSLTGHPVFINSADNTEYFWIKKEELDNLLEHKTVTKSYKLTIKPTYGASVSLPFKLRGAREGQNIRLTPDITLGGYLGIKWRLSRKESFYLSAPIVTVGLASLPIFDQIDGSDPDKGDGMVLGITASMGLVFQLKDFQFGLLVGWDKAAGEVGRDWLYNGRPWYSFSIGFSFLGDKNEQNK